MHSSASLGGEWTCGSQTTPPCPASRQGGVASLPAGEPQPMDQTETAELSLSKQLNQSGGRTASGWSQKKDSELQSLKMKYLTSLLKALVIPERAWSAGVSHAAANR